MSDFDDIVITSKQTEEYSKKFGLKKALTGLHLWGIGVGTVIAGSFFGWNYGLELAGSMGFLIATVVVTIFYVLLTTVFSELSTMLPYAGGPYAYVRKGIGPFAGYLSGVLSIVEFMFAASAVTVSISSYLSYFLPETAHLHLAMVFYMVFLAVNALGVKPSAIIQLIMTGIAVSALIIFFIGTADAVNVSTLWSQAQTIGSSEGIIRAIPYALWFYLCIEGISYAAEETKNPQKNMFFGFWTSILTVCILNVMVLVFCLSSVKVSQIIANDYPLSHVLSIVQPHDHVALIVFSALALSSLLASLNGMINGYSRQIFSLSRAGYLPKMLSRIHPMTKTPYLSILVPGLIGIILTYFFDAKDLIFASGLSALAMYMMVIHAYMRLKEKDLKKTKGTRHRSQWFMGLWGINLLLLACVLKLIFDGTALKAVLSALIVIGAYYFLVGRRFVAADAPEEFEAKDDRIVIK